jgi:hypothetical protein
MVHESRYMYLKFRIGCTFLVQLPYFRGKSYRSTSGWILLVPSRYERCGENSLLLPGMKPIFHHRAAHILPAILISHRACTSHLVNERVGKSTNKALQKDKRWPCRVYYTVSRFITYNLTESLSMLYKLGVRYCDTA